MGCLAVDQSLHFYRGDLLNKSYLISNHYRSRTEWSPILSVIIQVIKKKLDNFISPICLSLQESELLIMSMITERIGQHKALLLVNQHYDII